MVTKIPSVYPVWLPPVPKHKLAGIWLNLANVEELTFSERDNTHVLRMSSGRVVALPDKWADLIHSEFREMVTERRSPPTKPQPKQPA